MVISLISSSAKWEANRGTRQGGDGNEASNLILRIVNNKLLISYVQYFDSFEDSNTYTGSRGGGGGACIKGRALYVSVVVNVLCLTDNALWWEGTK